MIQKTLPDLLKPKASTVLRSITLSVLGTLLLITIWQFSRQDVFSSIVQIPGTTILGLIGIQFGAFLTLNLMWFVSARAAGLKVRYDDFMYINAQGNIVDSVTPGAKVGGEVTRVLQMSRFSGKSKQEAAAVVVIEKLFSMGVFFILAIFGVGIMVLRLPTFSALWLEIVLFSVSGVLFAIFLSFFLFAGRIRKKLMKKEKWGRVRRFLIMLTGHILSVRNKPKFWLPLLGLSIGYWLLYPLMLYLLHSGIPGATNADFFMALCISYVAYAAALVPATPGGLATFEATMAALLGATGLVVADALAVAVVFRLVTFWFMMIFSVAFAGFYRLGLIGRKKGRKMVHRAFEMRTIKKEKKAFDK